MDRTPDDVAFDLGLRLRRARFQVGMTLDEVAASTGVSRSTQSRMELGRGASVPLATWVTVAGAVGLDLVPATVIDAGALPAAFIRLAARGGWAATRVGPDGAWLDRPARPGHPGIPRVQAPAERVVVRVVRIVTDIGAERRRLQAQLRDARQDGPAGVVMEGLLVVVRASNNIRRLGRPVNLRRSSARWIMAMASPTALMPPLSSLVWITPTGSHLLPVV